MYIRPGRQRISEKKNRLTFRVALLSRYMGGDCSSNDKGNEEMGVCDSQEYESPFDAVFSRQIDLYKVEMHKNCVDFSALVTGIRNMLPEVWEHYDKNNDGALPH